MNSAEYRTLREALGLSLSEAARLHDVTDRTIQYWEGSSKPIKRDVEEAILELDAILERMVIETVELYDEQCRERGSRPEVVDLVRYRGREDYAGSRAAADGLPRGCHGILLDRTRRALLRLGQPVRISYAGDPIPEL